MAKIKIAGTTMTVESKITLEDLKKVERYEPNALKLTDENGEVVFAVCTDKGVGSISEYGACFTRQSLDGFGKAVISMNCPDGVENAVEYAEDKIGPAILNLNAVEQKVEQALSNIDHKLAEVREQIQIV